MLALDNNLFSGFAPEAGPQLTALTDRAAASYPTQDPWGRAPFDQPRRTPWLARLPASFVALPAIGSPVVTPGPSSRGSWRRRRRPGCAGRRRVIPRTPRTGGSLAAQAARHA